MSDVVYKEESKWFYEDEETFETIGPFDTEEIAIKAYETSLRWYAKDHQSNIRKMRDYEGM
jgi:hypothetical protein